MSDMQYSRRGFTIVELLLVIAVIAVLSSIALVSYSTLQARARDTQRIQDVESIQKAINLYLVRKGSLPPRSLVSTNWATSYQYPIDYIAEITSAGVDMATLPLDPRNSSAMHYRYYVYPAGTSGCPVSRGPFYVLQIVDMESSGRPHPKNPGFICRDRDWSTEADYTVGGYTD